MTILTFSLSLLGIGCAAGFLGALTGLGGGIIITPILVLFFHVDLHIAMGASLIAVLATSSGTAVAYLKEGYTNLRIGLFLEVAAILGVFLGVYLTVLLSPAWISLIFGFVMVFSAYRTLRRNELIDFNESPSRLAVLLQLNDRYPTKQGYQSYTVQNIPIAFGLFGVAGILSGLLGIGCGAVKVLAMDQAMRLPYKVSTTTSNFIMGITAATSVGIYFARGYINLHLAGPVMLGVLLGALIGTKVLVKAETKKLRLIFSLLAFVFAAQMIGRGIMGLF